MAKKKRRGGRKKNKAIPVIMTLTAAYPSIKAYDTVGLTKDLPQHLVYRYTGYATWDGSWNKDIPIKLGTGMAISYIAHKVATKVGVNKTIRKLTGGWLEL